MPSQKELRAARKAEKQDQKRLSAQRLKASLANNHPKQVKITIAVLSDKRPRGVELRSEFLGKRPIINANPSVYQSPMTWCAQIADIEGSWPWAETRQWSEEEWRDELVRKLDSLEGKRWSEIASMTTGSGKRRNRRKLHHSQEVSTLNSDAQRRWLDLDLEVFDTAYRFRFGGTKRVWGFQAGNHFYLIWYERLHKICPQ